MASLRDLCTRLGFGPGGPENLEAFFTATVDMTDELYLNHLLGGTADTVHSKHDPSFMLLDIKGFLDLRKKNLDVLEESRLYGFRLMVAVFLSQYGCNYWGKHRASAPRFGFPSPNANHLISELVAQIFQIYMQTSESATQVAKNTASLTSISDETHHRSKRYNIVDLEDSEVESEDGSSMLSRGKKSNIIDLENFEVESDEELFNQSRSKTSNFIDLENFEVEADEHSSSLGSGHPSDLLHCSADDHSLMNSSPLKLGSEVSAPVAVNGSVTRESTPRQASELGGMGRKLANTEESTETRNPAEDSKKTVVYSKYNLPDKTRSKLVSLDLRRLHTNALQARSRRPAKRPAPSTPSPHWLAGDNISGGGHSLRSLLTPASTPIVSPSRKRSAKDSHSITNNLSSSLDYQRKRLQSSSLELTPRPQKKPAASKSTAIGPETTFHFFLSDPTLGAVAHSASTCDTANAFFDAALAAWKLTASKQQQEPVLVGLKVSWDGGKRPAVLPWRDAESFNKMMATVGIAKNLEQGGLDVEVSCIVQS